MSSFESNGEFPIPKNSESSAVTLSADAAWQKSCSSVQLSSGKSVLACNAPRCNYKTDKNSNFKRHFETMHCALSHPKVCCSLRFLTKGEFRYHTKTVHCQGHRCLSCKKLFNRRALLDRHMSIHTGNKPFHCPECDYASANKANVRRHLSVHKVKGNGDTENSITSVSEKGSNCDLSLRPAVAKQHASPDLIKSPISAVTCLEDSSDLCYSTKEAETDSENTKNDTKESHVKEQRQGITHSIDQLLSRPYTNKSDVTQIWNTSTESMKDEPGTQLIKNEVDSYVSNSSYSINPNWSHTSALSSWTHFPEAHFSTQQGFTQVSGHDNQVPVSYPTTSLMTPPTHQVISDGRYKWGLYDYPFLPGTSDKSHSDLGLALRRHEDVVNSGVQNETSLCGQAPHQESRIVPNHFSHFKVEAQEGTQHQVHLPNDSARGCVIDCCLNYEEKKGAGHSGMSPCSLSLVEHAGKSELLVKKGKRVVDLMNEPPPPPVPTQKVLKKEGVSPLSPHVFPMKCQFIGGEYIHKKLRAVGKRKEH